MNLEFPLESIVKVQSDELKHIIILWTPSHVDIKGNEKADAAAKEATDQDVSTIGIPHSDYKQTMQEYIIQRWQSQWDNTPFNKLKNIKPRIGSLNLPKNLQRKDQTTLHRLRLGHTRYTHSFLLKKEEPPTCNTCQTSDTVEHFMASCKRFHQARIKFLHGKTLPEILTQTPVPKILEYIKEIGLYNKI